MSRVFVDTSAWIAYIDARDPDNRRVVPVLGRAGLRRVTSNYVFDELITLVQSRYGHDAAARAGLKLRDTRVAERIRVTSDDEEAAWRLFEARPDKTYSFTDCTSFVLMRRLGIDTAVSLDDDFVQEGFTALPR